MSQFIIAENLSVAATCARIQRWTQRGAGRWYDDVGAEIRYADRIQDLRGHGPGTVVYLGHGWRKVWSRHHRELVERGMVLDEC